MIVAIDESTTCSGYSVFNDENVLIRYGKFDLKKEKDSIARLSKMILNIKHIIEIYNPSTVIIEDILITMNASTARVLLSLQTILELYCYEANIECVKYRTTKWRKILGLSNSPKMKRLEKKKEALDYINNKYNIQLENDDIADAVCLATAYLIEKGMEQ